MTKKVKPFYDHSNSYWCLCHRKKH